MTPDDHADGGADDGEGGEVRELLTAIRADVAAIRRQTDSLARAFTDLACALDEADSLADVDAVAVRGVDEVPAADGVTVGLTPRERAAARDAGDSPREYVARAVAHRFEVDGVDEVLDSLVGEGGRCPVCGEPVATRVSAGDGEGDTLQPCGHIVPADRRLARDGADGGPEQ